MGQQTIGDVNDDADIELAEELMLSVHDSFQRGEGDESVDVPDRVKSDIDVENSATYNLTLDGNPECSTGNRSLHTVQYTNGGEEVGYEGGGVWRMTESGATMSSPPSVSYDSGSLSLSFANVTGESIEGDSVSVQSNTTRKRSHEAALAIAMYTDASYEDARSGVTSPSQECIPAQVSNATLTIHNSTYARAWADWARQTYDDKYVTVTSTNVEPGDPVRIEFSLGDVSDPRFAVEDISVTHNETGSGANVTATVRNTGGLRSTQDVTLEHNRTVLGSTPSETQAVTLDGGETKNVTTGLETGSEMHDFNASTDDSYANTTFEVDPAVGGPPNLQITGSSFPATARLNQVPSATVTVTNTGGMTATQTVTFEVNGSTNDTRSVAVHPGDSRTIDFGPALPTDSNGTYNLSVETDDDKYSQYHDDGTYFVVGDAGVFEITSIDPPSGLESGDEARVEATIENTGDIRKDATVAIRIENATTGDVMDTNSTTFDLNGTRRGSENKTISVTNSSIIVDDAEHFNYVVETPDETRTGSFAVGDSSPPLFEITEFTVDNPVATGNETTVNLTVENTGGTAGTQTVAIHRETTTVLSTNQQLDVGERTEFQTTVQAPDEPRKYPVIATTDNRTRQKILNVQPDSLIDGDGNTITINTAVNASIDLKGAELEGIDRVCYGCEPTIVHAPVQMSLFVENSTGTHQVELWREYENGDVNGPYAERRLVDDDYDNPYTYSGSFEEGTNVSVFSRSYRCDDYDETDPAIHLSGYNTSECTDWGSVRIPVSQSENSDNLVILNNSEELPAYQQAQFYQRGIDDMLGERLNDTGHLQLAEGERAFLYELSKHNADPENAAQSDDPDYNDAVVLFRVTAIEKEVQTGPEYTISAVDAPAQVDETEKAHVTAAVTNTGGKTGKPTVQSTFDGHWVDSESKVLAPNESKEFTFVFDTDSKTPEQSYPYNVSIMDNGESWSGNIYVGEQEAQFMQVDSVQGPPAADVDDSPTATVNVTNVGGQTGTDTVALVARNDDHASPTFTTVDTTAVNIASGDTHTIDLDMPAGRGNYTYHVATANSTSPNQTYFVGQSNVVINETGSINIGAKTYNTSELIERRGGADRMTVEVVNNGSIGEERVVGLTVTNKSNGSTVYSDTTNVTAGSGDLTGIDEYPAWAGYDVDLDPGYYTYEVTVYNETTSDSVDDTATGEIFLQEVDETGSTGNDSPISVDSDSVTLGG